MLIDHWPLLGIHLRTPRLLLRLPTEEELADLADLAVPDIHPPEEMPFLVPWTDLPPRERARSVVQYHWRQLGAWTPEAWSMGLVAFLDGRPVGHQSLGATDFATLRQVNSGSWLGRPHQGQGLGTEMRAAVLELAFAGLGAVEAMSGALAHNAASLRVSEKMGYERDGIVRVALRGGPATEHRLRLSRERWERHRTVPVTLDGLDGCLPLFGA
ncbi:GNAT family N-acetyltransferase [Streptomyces avicenniae]|uniref:GNAT family N-acetyltransferase n=1 Tax=Streptomyces avicenniae TaxID=500153 RepID=UPI00069BCACD|nr:GNAT family protein [Streptomyces avicenniae]